jgi:hypothetical protein
MNRTTLLAALGLALVTHIASASRGATIYNVVNYPALQNGYTLSGTIVTDDRQGPLAANDIAMWSITVTGGPAAFSVSSFNSNGVGIENFLIATPTQLTLAVGNPINNLDLGFTVFPQSARILWQNAVSQFGGGQFTAGPDSTTTAWNATQLPPNALGGAPWVIAQVIPGSFPEPGTLTLALTGIPCIAAGLWARRRFSRSHDDTVSREFSAAQ